MDHLIPPLSPTNRWWSEETTAVVTGANKGIGFAVVKRLLELGLTVVLTARNAENGIQAADSLRLTGFRNVHFCCLDISDPASIAAFASWFRHNFGVLDILVNNAAVSFNAVGENLIKEPETIIKTNFYGPKLLTEALLPLFRRSDSVSRILNMSSRLGTLNKLRSPSIRRILESEDLTNEQIDATVTQFLQDVKSGTWEKQGWPENWPDYAISKMVLNAYSRVLARRYDGKKLSVNCLCPGFTRTSMTGGQGTHTADEAAATVAKLVLVPPEKLTSGKFYICLEPKKIIAKL
ncbi:Short-chain dehydrogenase/reductase SDR [Arabidopsis thaliana x Arabidopsis arenosa]|uniref:Short-chain dehydrogenase/reductase SDR n=1 Tax=Arabidopsis thaliana x Arabidopsis arenosa TaxID=1240361 RepID=A0A8T1ZPS9_9BRAS|nr:Short-chain dehydrogenase/reductase SDR [Arabidopsis thaliana x Arabidopsis arenosa]